jgi:hypothetical protein
MNLPWHRFLPRYVPASYPSVFIPWLQNKGFAWSKKKKVWDTSVAMLSMNLFLDAWAFPNTML